MVPLIAERWNGFAHIPEISRVLLVHNLFGKQIGKEKKVDGGHVYATALRMEDSREQTQIQLELVKAMDRLFKATQPYLPAIQGV
jgi:hypothetical protein